LCPAGVATTMFARGRSAVVLWRTAKTTKAHTKGAYRAFFKLPAGFAVPLHTHTYDIKVVIVSGTYIQSPEGSPNSGLGLGRTSCSPAYLVALTWAMEPTPPLPALPTTV